MSVYFNTDTTPVRIHVQQKSIAENRHLYVTCSTFWLKKRNMGYVYLCKDGVGILRAKQEQDKNDIPISIQVGRDHSGNYSCVYSTTMYEPSEVAKQGLNIIPIRVIRKYIQSYEGIIMSMPCFSYLYSISAMQPIFSLQIFQ